MASLDALVHGERVNALLGWTLTGVVGVAAVESFLTGALLWAGFALVVVGVIALPAVRTGHRWMIVPWPLLLVAAVAVTIRAAGLYPETAGYLAVASLALVVVVELDAFTPVEMSRRFGVAFAVMTTMAMQGWWTVAQFYADRWLDSEFLRSQTELQWDFVSVTVVGFVLGGAFLLYARRFGPVGSGQGPTAEGDSR